MCNVGVIAIFRRGGRDKFEMGLAFVCCIGGVFVPVIVTGGVIGCTVCGWVVVVEEAGRPMAEV